MLFNSIDFAVFLPIVFVLYWFVTHKNLKSQNLLIVLASYLFMGDVYCHLVVSKLDYLHKGLLENNIP
jgi:hypothetical protein